jgi:hypothetical protein
VVIVIHLLLLLWYSSQGCSMYLLRCDWASHGLPWYLTRPPPPEARVCSLYLIQTCSATVQNLPHCHQVLCSVTFAVTPSSPHYVSVTLNIIFFWLHLQLWLWNGLSSENLFRGNIDSCGSNYIRLLCHDCCSPAVILLFVTSPLFVSKHSTASFCHSLCFVSQSCDDSLCRGCYRLATAYFDIWSWNESLTIVRPVDGPGRPPPHSLQFFCLLSK